MFTLRLWIPALLVLVFGVSVEALSIGGLPEDAFWQGWRERQRAELATLPKPPTPPTGEGGAVERFLTAAWKRASPAAGPVIDDAAFARRAYLDTIGLLPTPQELEKFQADGDPHKRQALVDKLLFNKLAYAEHWMTFWNDLLRNDEQTNIDGLRKPITGWLFASLLANKPIDLFVAELLSPGKKGPDGYLKGVNWRGRVNASQTPPVQAAQNVSQVFLASSIKCASCHDSFISHWKLREAYGMASFFAPRNLEMHRCDKPTGKIIAPAFLFPDLGNVSPSAGLQAREQAVARMVTSPRNPRFARTIINRLWKRLLGWGLIEPADDFDSRPVQSDLLDWLAYDFMSHDYDVKHALRMIMLSRVYQSPVAAPVHSKDSKRAVLPIGPVERRLTSEQFLDAVSQVTGYWPTAPVMNVTVPDSHVRAWRYKKPDSLCTALGRPNREQVCTERKEDSTVLQALELVNGAPLRERLREGARKLLASELGKETDTDKVTRTLYVRALSRPADAAESALAKTMLGSPGEPRAARQEKWEDFLWLLVMNPDLQFVR